MVNYSGRCGEHLVCAQLWRQKIIATTFSSNMPDFDILTPLEKIQIKTSKQKQWMLNAECFLEFDKELLNQDPPKQKVIEKKQIDSDIIFVFVYLDKKYVNDRFFILRKSQVQDIMYKSHSNWLKSKKYIRPKNKKSMNAIISLKDITEYEDNWEVIKNE